MKILHHALIILGAIIISSCQTKTDNSKTEDKNSEFSNNKTQSNLDTSSVSSNKMIETNVLSNVEIGTNPEKTMTHNEALAYCESLGDGWRMPNREEMRAIYEIKDSLGFFGYYFWTSELADNESAWYQYMGKGGTQHITPMNGEKFVWPIRDKNHKRK